MTQTQFVTDMAAELVQSMGMELVIFAVSFTVALTMRGVGFGKQMTPCQRELAAGMRASRLDTGRGKKEIRQETLVSDESLPSAALERKIDTMVNCASRRQCAEAISIYSEMRDNGEHVAIKALTKRSRKGASDVFAALVQCAGNLGRPDLVETLLDDMIAADISRSLTFYETTMKMLASKKCYKGALAVYNRLEADGLEASSVTLSCLISFAVELGESERAICFFERLSACCTPSIRAYMTILRVYSKRADGWIKSLDLIRDMQRCQAPIDSLVLNIVLSTGVSACELDAAKALLKEFSDIKLADVVSYNTLLKGFAKQQDANQALDLLKEMHKTGVKPNVITFNTVIDAAIRSGRDVDAWGVLKEMIEANVSPDKYTCTTLMKGIQAGATSQQLTVILGLLKNVPVDNNSCINFLFRSVIEAAAQMNDPTLTAKAISQMREQRVRLSPTENQRLLRLLMREK